MEEQNLTQQEREKLHKKQIEDKIKQDKNKKIIKKVVIYSVLLLAIVFIIYVVNSNAKSPGEYDDFAKCLTDKDAKFYGSFQCPHCADQKKLFGKSIKYVNYIECGPLGGPQNQICVSAGIQAYPTWIIGNQTLQGVLSLRDLSQLSNCNLPV